MILITVIIIDEIDGFPACNGGIVRKRGCRFEPTLPKLFIPLSQT
jgi:hypothetical protein